MLLQNGSLQPDIFKVDNCVLHNTLHNDTHRSFRGIPFVGIYPRKFKRYVKQPDRNQKLACRASVSTYKVQLLNPVATERLGQLPPLVYIPGSDGTGNSIAPQLPGLTAAGFDVRCLYIPTSDRSDWDELTRLVVSLLRQLIEESSVSSQVTLVAESFGGCLGLRLAAAAPELIERLVLVNAATSFSRALSGLPSLIADTNLLSLFPESLYQVAQAVLVPLLVDKDNVGPSGLKAIQSMMVMRPTPDFQPEKGGFVNVNEERKLAQLGPMQLYEPAVTASWRLRMLRRGNVPDEVLARIRAPTLIVASAADRLLPSLEESGRLVSKISHARRVVLPNSGHTALLESGISLAQIMGRTGFLPEAQPSPHKEVAAQGVPATAHSDTAVVVDASRIAEGTAQDTRRVGNGVTAQMNGSNDVQTRGAGVASAAALEAAFQNGHGSAGTARSVGPESSSAEAANGMSSISRGASDGAVQPSSSNGATLIPTMAGAVQQPSPQSRQQGTVWGQGAAGRGSTRRTGIDSNFEEALQLLGPLRTVVAPVVRGAENIPDGAVSDRACLFVGNHTRFGMYDLPFLMYELYLRGHKVRGLAHPAHWNGPAGRVFERFGAVAASPRAAYRLLKQGESVLLFPGGGREVNKLKGQEYQLQWKEQPDFVRMAAKLNAIIIPFAAVGGDDAFDVALDTSELLADSILGPLARGALERVAPGLDPEEAVPPITRGLFGLPSPLPLPKLERIYFRFMAPMDPNDDMCKISDEGGCTAMYRKVRGSVEEGIAQLLAERELDPERDLGPRLLGQAARFLPAFDLISSA